MRKIFAFLTLIGAMSSASVMVAGKNPPTCSVKFQSKHVTKGKGASSGLSEKYCSNGPSKRKNIPFGAPDVLVLPSAMHQERNPVLQRS
jgi:hypothetical protein